MSIIAEAVKHLIAAGVGGDQLVAAIADMEAAMPAARDHAADRRRERDRAYQANRRRQTSADSADIGDAPRPDKEKSPRPSKEINPSPKPARRRREADGTRLPEGWRPVPLSPGIAKEIADRRGREWVRRAFETFENHWRAKPGKYALALSWQATWANWIIEQDRRDGNGRSNGRTGGGSGTGKGDGFANALAEWRAIGEADDPFAPDERGMRNVTPVGRDEPG